MQVKLTDAWLEQLEGMVETRVAQVSVAYVERDADVVEVADVKDLEQMFRRGDVVLQIFKQHLNTERMGEGFYVLYGGKRVVDRGSIPRIVLEAEVERDGRERNLLGRLERALHLVHGLDAMGFVG